MRILLSAVLLASVTFACSTAKVRIMPGDDGVNRVYVRDIERDNAEEAAVEGATEYCKDRNQEAIFFTSKNKTEYTGSMDEETRNNVRKASKIAMVLGGVGVGARQTTPGAVVGTAGTVGYGMTSDRDYQSYLEFRCK